MQIATFRTEKTERAYTEYKLQGKLNNDCLMCVKVPIKTFEKWKRVENSFPYDAIATIHHVLTPIRHSREDDLTTEEISELKLIKSTYLNDNYECIIESTTHRQSIPKHFHLHLIVAKTPCQ